MGTLRSLLGRLECGRSWSFPEVEMRRKGKVYAKRMKYSNMLISIIFFSDENHIFPSPYNFHINFNVIFRGQSLSWGWGGFQKNGLSLNLRDKQICGPTDRNWV